jgi:ATP-binding cassette subfamily B protein
MRLRSDIPPAVAARLGALGVRPEHAVLAFSSDIDLRGSYDPQWIIATRDVVCVFDQGRPAAPRVNVAMEQIEEFRTIPAVGSGLLQAKVGGIWIDLIRYSNRMKYWFGRLARHLQQLRESGLVELGPEDEQDPRRCPKCGLMLQFAGETCPRCIRPGGAIIRVLRLMRPYWPWATLMMGLLLVGIACDMIGPLLTRYLVDNVLRTESVSPAPAATSQSLAQGVHLLVSVVAVLALVQMLRAIINALNGRLSSRVGTSITYDIRGRLVEHLEQLDLSYYDKQQVGSLVGRVAYDTEAVQGFMSQLTAGFFVQLLLVVFSAVLMFSLEPKLAVWTFIPAPLVVLGSLLFYRVVHPHYRRFYDRSSKQAGMLSGILSGIRVVKAFAQEQRELSRFMESSSSLRDARRMVDSSAATFYPLMGIVFQVGGWVVWYVGGGRVLGQQLTLGTLMAFFGYLAMFYGPLASLTNLTTWVTQFSTQIHRIFEVLDTPIAIRQTEAAVALPAIRGHIEFRNVTFGYSRQAPVLKNVSFTIEAGQTLGIVGRSGSGKTTIINLLSRYYDVDEGQILIDGNDVRDAAMSDLRRQMGVVLQEPSLFRGTLWDNMVYGRRDATEEQVIAACRAANAHDFVLRRYHAYDTWVGERGAGLSGGERQRLSIARALLCDPRILILDEATSSVDSESELAIQKALEELVRGRTSILIAHRLSTLRNCDDILVIEEGRVAEQGNHMELMKRRGRYAKFVRLQSTTQAHSDVDHSYALRPLTGSGELAGEPGVDPDTHLPPITSHHARWLTPQTAAVHLGNHGALHVTVMNERIYHGVFALRCLPVRHPARYVSLRYLDIEDREQEIGLVRDIEEWPAEARQLIQEALLRRYFVHTIQRIDSINSWHNFLTFKVQTDLGDLEFIIRYAQDAALDYGRSGKILLDLEENRYLIPDVAALPQRDRRLFERYVYW